MAEGTPEAMSFPIPDAALDDRFAFTGIAGAGKTYGASSAVERLLDKHRRVILIDPLDVSWGLRLSPDGKSPSAYQPVIIGGAHGDLPLNEYAGLLIGETVATAAESFIVSLSTLATKAAERRFMLAFLTALYRFNKEPVHLIFDEADLWAPQRLLDKEGEAAKLLGMMESIIRRGRVRGFIPWLITQRPAVISKDVLSQIDAMTIFKLTSSQDRDAIGDWVSGQADKEQWKQMWAGLPAMQRGQCVIWVPGRGLLKTTNFPTKSTFDSSAAPKRGERPRGQNLQPLNVDALKSKLAIVTKEAEANDPKKLRAEIGRLMQQIATLERARMNKAPDDALIQNAHRQGLVEGYRKALQTFEPLAGKLRGMAEDLVAIARDYMMTPMNLPAVPPQVVRQPPPAPPVKLNGPETEPLPPIVRRIIDVIHAAYPIGLTFAAAAARATVSPRSSQYRYYERLVRVSRELEFRDGRYVSAPGFGREIAISGDPIQSWAERLPPSFAAMLNAIADVPLGLSREEVAQRANVSATSSGLNKGLGELIKLQLVELDDGLYKLTPELRER